MNNQPTNASVSGKLALAVTPSIKLRKGQASLYEFIVAKHEAKETITLNDVVALYSEYGNRNIIHGNPYYYEYDYKEQSEHLAPLKGDMLKSYAIQWFIRNLGVFVIKGLLTALPTMQLKDIQIEEES